MTIYTAIQGDKALDFTTLTLKVIKEAKSYMEAHEDRVIGSQEAFVYAACAHSGH